MKTWLLAAAFGSAVCGGAAIAQDMPPPNNPGGGGQYGGQYGGPPPGGRHGGMGGPAGAMMRADTNGDGVVTRVEYSAAIGQRFDAMDTDRDGVLSEEERPGRGSRQYGAAGAPPPPGDTNGTPPPPGADGGPPRTGMGAGPITRQAFVGRAMRRFDRMDVNHDGKIDHDEMAAAATMMRERHVPTGDNGGPGGDMPAPPPQRDDQ